MSRFLPLIFLASAFSLFGALWIVFDVDPDVGAWYFFVLLAVFAFIAIFGFVGLLIYFLRTRFIKRFDAIYYFKTSFKVSFFAASFFTIVLVLRVLKIMSTLNMVLAIFALLLFAIYSFWGGKDK